MKPRSTALYILTAIAVMFVLQQAEEVLLPVVLAALISFALSPLVSRMSVWKVHRTLSAGILLSIFVCLLVFSFYAFGDQLNEIVLATPIMMTCKVICDRIDGLKGIGELLGE